ncbi:MAG TPA: hypothetical protein VNG71_06445 [Pyrinomonadaceae bacterium]|nr:hypothetical protein [Pyrinomonadaceae bacterium]
MKIANWSERAALNSRFVALIAICVRLAQTGQDFSFIAGAHHFRPTQTGRNRSPHLHFSIFNFHFAILFFVTLYALLFALCSKTTAQTVVDKTVASVTNGARATPDLITYSDLVWQLALEPDRALADPPSSKDLNEALKTLEDQLLILQEARKLPIAETAEGRKDFEKAVTDMLNDLVRRFHGRERLQERMSQVGLTSEQLDAILRDRVTIERYLDFRFRAFAIATPKEISDRYQKLYGAGRNGGKIVPTLDEARDRLEEEVKNEKIAVEIDNFVDSLRDQPGTEISVLNPV